MFLSLNNVYYYCLCKDKVGTCIYLVDALEMLSFLIPTNILLDDLANENEHQNDAQNLIPRYNLAIVKSLRRVLIIIFI